MEEADLHNSLIRSDRRDPIIPWRKRAELTWVFSRSLRKYADIRRWLTLVVAWETFIRKKLVAFEWRKEETKRRIRWEDNLPLPVEEL